MIDVLVAVEVGYGKFSREDSTQSETTVDGKAILRHDPLGLSEIVRHEGTDFCIGATDRHDLFLLPVLASEGLVIGLIYLNLQALVIVCLPRSEAHDLDFELFASVIEVGAS